jgi:hypothetical protein
VIVRATLDGMWAIVLGLLALWLVFSIVGLVVKGLMWLFIIGVILFLATAAWGWIKERS